VPGERCKTVIKIPKSDAKNYAKKVQGEDEARYGQRRDGHVHVEVEV